MLLYPIGKTEAVHHAAHILQKSGITLIDHPSPEVTHLLLDIPSKNREDLDRILSMLPPDVRIIGGNLHFPGANVWDLLKDEEYTAQNAAITAHCAIKVALPYLKTTLSDTPTLIIGWGRIGKCLSKLLKALDCPVTVAARNPSHRAILQALGYGVQGL